MQITSNLFWASTNAYRVRLLLIDRLKGKVLLKGRRITDKREDYYSGSGTAYDSDSDVDSEIDNEDKSYRDDQPVSHVSFS